ncbi:Zinc finger protein LSD1 [Zostera marina]|uniref:Zinc finger protein LSD1 n=1 Tax=Zostera marina TaxID=29655 RepID=A0A0K9P8B8_ZOSMR|nr:Zinc finger protein LSD1 [Zostera marina]
MQSQIVCAGCRSTLLYSMGATNVRCAICNTITLVSQPPTQSTASDMAQLFCGGCRTLLMYPNGATNVRCTRCNTINASRGNQVARMNCGNCNTTLMYSFGAANVKCVVCQYITNVWGNNLRPPVSVQSSLPSTSSAPPPTKTQTVVVENPKSLDGNGRMISNVAVGVTSEKV